MACATIRNAATTKTCTMTAFMTLLIASLVFGFFFDFALSQQISCDVTSVPYYNVNGRTDLFLRHVIDSSLQTVSIELTYAGLAWLALGFTNKATMINSTSVVGIVDASGATNGSVATYHMDGYALSDVNLIFDPIVQDSVTKKGIIQNDTHTVLSFTRDFNGYERYLEVDVVPSSTTPTQFIWAIGTSNELLMHTFQGSDSVVLSNDCANSAVAPAVAPTTTNTSTTTTAPASAPVSSPVSTTMAPISSTMAPVSASTAPVSATMAPVSATMAPVSTTMAPLSTTMAPGPVTGAPVSEPAPAPPTGDVDLDCSFRSETGYPVEGRTDLFLRHMINQNTKTLTLELTYAGIGYVSMGFQPEGKMYPAIGVIGLPDDQTVSKYKMTGISADLVTLITDETIQSTITNSSIVQNETHTVLTYARVLDEADPDDTDILEDGENTFIWAVGGSNPLSLHIQRGSDKLVFDKCLEVGKTLAPIAPTTSSPSLAPIVAVAPTDAGVSGEDGIISLADGVTSTISVSEDGKSVTVELTYAGSAWISVGVSPTGKMTDSIAIIGSNADNPPRKYDMSGYSLADVVVSPEARQTLIDAEFTQDATQTYMKFTKLMEEENETPILSEGKTTFLWAIGTENAVQMHVQRGDFKWEPCKEGDVCGVEKGSSAVPNKGLWLAHGICMALSWIIIIPSAVASSLLRSLMPQGPLWFKVHKNLNIVGVLLTVIGFILGIVAVSDEDKDHFTLNAHYKTGLVIFLFAVFQALNGIFKPPAPAPAPTPTPSDNKKITGDDDNDDDVEADGPPPETAPIPTPKKSVARLSWEIYHRILGFSLLGISWYNCGTGFELYNIRYQDDYTKAMWGVVGGTCGLFVILYTYAKTK